MHKCSNPTCHIQLEPHEPVWVGNKPYCVGCAAELRHAELSKTINEVMAWGIVGFEQLTHMVVNAERNAGVTR